MKKLLMILLLGIFFSCGVTKVNTETKKDKCCKNDTKKEQPVVVEEPVKSDPVTSSLMVHNKTGMDIYVNCSFCVDKVNDTTLVKKDSSYLIQSNNHSPKGTIFTIGIHGPKDGCDGKPVNPSGWGGQLPVGYGYWNGAAHITCQPEKGNANPTAQVPDYDGNWIFEYSFKDGSHNAQVFDEVTITTKCTK